jgi:hypothetical protein
MARTAKPARGGRVGRPAGAGRGAPKAASGTRRGAASATRPKISKDELRDQVAKLEEANTRLRGRNRELGRTAKAAEARVAELEEQLAAMERRAARTAPAASGRRGRGRGRDIDPGDAVPEGVAVQEPEPPDEEALAVRERLEDQFSGD